MSVSTVVEEPSLRAAPSHGISFERRSDDATRRFTVTPVKLPRVVIVGAGFGGIAAVKALTRAPVEVTIVDQHNFHTFSPLLYQVATAGLASEDIAPNLRGIVQRARNVEARMATVHGVDFDRHEVLVDHGVSIPYDYLILAAGAVSSDFGVPGVAEHALALKTLADATRVRSTVLRRFEEANTDPSLIDGGTLTFVVAGGGPTGVELCGGARRAVHEGAGEGLQEPRRRTGAGDPRGDGRPPVGRLLTRVTG